jgi:hypothetical protein
VIDEHSGIRDLKHRWDEEDKTRYELERQAQRAFLEQEAMNYSRLWRIT